MDVLFKLCNIHRGGGSQAPHWALRNKIFVLKSSTLKKFTTSTLRDKEIVPWLSADGSLSYSPRHPPDKNYYFQYSWIIPEIIHFKENRRRYFWFGSPCRTKYEVQLLFEFWNNARQGNMNELFLSNGKLNQKTLISPIGAYLHKRTHAFQQTSLILIQHGSYLITDINEQPEIEDGNVILYRGIQDAKIYKRVILNNSETRIAIMRLHEGSLSDSVVSFNIAHCNIARTETTFLNDRSWMLNEWIEKQGLDPQNEEIYSMLYSGYSLNEWCAKNKFGPNYVKFKSPATNIRITTFICNEAEVKVIDPNKLEIIEVVGCRIKERVV